MAEHRRFPVTFENVRLCASEFGFDRFLCSLLWEAGSIYEVDNVTEVDKSEFALSLLNLEDGLLDNVLRVALVSSLDLDNYLDIEDIEVVEGDLLPLLLRNRVIDDTAQTYEHLDQTDWATRREFIRHSLLFADYMTPSLVGQDLKNMLSSNDISDSIKRNIIKNTSEYCLDEDLETWAEIARLALHFGVDFSPEEVRRIAQAGVPSSSVLPLLAPHLDSISTDLLREILLALEGDYPNLAVVGRSRVHVEKSEANILLLERLKLDGIVSSYDPKFSKIPVFRKHK